MQNSYEQDFKKYLKYKSKYLELKNLLEGGIPLGPPAGSGFLNEKEQKDKCTKYNGDEKCELITPNCKENFLYKKKNKNDTWITKCIWREPSLSELLKKK